MKPFVAVMALLLSACGAFGNTPGPSSMTTLEGTSWQLVKFEGGDGAVLTPEAKDKYTIQFAENGRFSMRVACNRGVGAWQSSGPNQLEFSRLALTRAMCPADSLHDRIMKDWQFVRSYVLKDGRLFLALMADGGIYELERRNAASVE